MSARLQCDRANDTVEQHQKKDLHIFVSPQPSPVDSSSELQAARPADASGGGTAARRSLLLRMRQV